MSLKIEILGDAAIQIANILEEQNRLKEAFFYSKVAYEKYKYVYGENSENTIIALWLML